MTPRTTPPTRGWSSWTGTPGEFRPPRYASPQRLLPDGRPYPTAGRLVGRWQKEYLVHGEGDALGQRVRLVMFDRYVLNRALEYDPLTGRLLYDRVLIGVGKGNAKTESMARFGLAELAGPIAPLSPRVVMSAASYDQTKELFTAATLGITGTQDSPGPLARYFREGDHLMDSRILYPDGHGYIERIAAVGGTSDGGKPTTHIGDELHEWLSAGQERVWVVQSKSLRKRRVPRRTPPELNLPDGVLLHGAMQIGITTAGVNPNTLLGRLYEHGVAVAEGREVDPGFLFLWWQADPSLDLDDPAQRRQAILQANPCVGEFLPFENKESSFWDLTVPRSDFVRYDTNVWPDSDGQDPWMDPDLWDGCAGDVVFKPALPVYGAVRIAHSNRHAAVAIAQRQGETVVLRARTFEAPDVDGEYLDVEAIEQHILGLHRRYSAPVVAEVRYVAKGAVHTRNRPGPEILYHGAFFEGSAQRLKAVGVVMPNEPTTSTRLTPAAATLIQLATAGHLIHDGDPALTRQVRNVIARPVDQGFTIDASTDMSGAPRPIVAAQAAMLAVHRAIAAPAPKDQTLYRRPPR